MQYIGETENSLHIRMNGRRSYMYITTKKVGEKVSCHFNQQGHTLEDLRVMGIEKIHNAGLQINLLCNQPFGLVTKYFY